MAYKLTILSIVKIVIPDKRGAAKCRSGIQHKTCAGFACTHLLDPRCLNLLRFKASQVAGMTLG